MKVLALDTAMAACSAAVHDSSAVLASAFVAMERGHAEAIAPMVRDVMSEARLDFAKLDRILVTRGPGTFTGVRIGLAMARGLGLALDIPVAGIDTLSAIAANAGENDAPLLVAADARKDEVYAALFGPSGKMLQPPAVLSIADCLRLLPKGSVQVMGTGAEAVTAASLRSDLTRNRSGDLPNAANFGGPGFALALSEAMPEPLYLRAPDAKLPINIQSATAAQAGILARLHAQCFDPRWAAEEFAALLAMPGAAAALAFSASEPSGFILTRKTANEIEIITIGTIPFARRKGVAKALLHHQCTGGFHCFIEVAASNAAARGLYASCGFNETGVRRGYYEKTGEDAILMRRDSTP